MTTLPNRTYKMSDGLTVKTKNVAHSWYTPHQVLHKTRKGTFWIEYLGDGWAEYIDRRRAVIWMGARGMEIPEDLKTLAAEMEGKDGQ
jgi:hypothetical protein